MKWNHRGYNTSKKTSVKKEEEMKKIVIVSLVIALWISIFCIQTAKSQEIPNRRQMLEEIGRMAERVFLSVPW